VTVSSPLYQKSIAEVGALIESREISPLEVTQAMLERIDSLNDNLHAFTTVSSELALQQAQKATDELDGGHYKGAMHGIPCAVKDLIDTKGIRTTCGSKIYSARVPAENATVIDRLEAAGAVLLGKLVLTEFAGIGYHPTVEPPRNPWNADYWTGQSSSGSGVAAAAGMCFGALGTDTGGSLRFPASACGVVGLRPTYGRVSRHGTFPLAETLDAVGPIGRTVEDVAILLATIAGVDNRDPTSLRDPVPDYRAALRGTCDSVRIGVAEAMLDITGDAQVRSAVMTAADRLSDLGAVVSAITIPMINETVAAWGSIFVAECLLAHEPLYPARADDYSDALRMFLEQGGAISGTDYARANLTRLAAQRAFTLLFDSVDVLLLPTMGCLPPSLEEFPASGIIPQESAGALLSFTAPFALTGHPALSICCGFSDAGLPIGLQLVGPYGSEELLLRVAANYENATSWTDRRPQLSEQTRTATRICA